MLSRLSCPRALSLLESAQGTHLYLRGQFRPQASKAESLDQVLPASCVKRSRRLGGWGWVSDLAESEHSLVGVGGASHPREGGFPTEGPFFFPPTSPLHLSHLPSPYPFWGLSYLPSSLSFTLCRLRSRPSFSWKSLGSRVVSAARGRSVTDSARPAQLRC